MRALQLAAIVFAPWWYGGAPDSARYLIATTLLLAASAWLWKRPALDTRVTLPAVAVIAWSILQAVIVSTSPIPTLGSTIVLTAILSVLIFWSTEAQDET